MRAKVVAVAKTTHKFIVYCHVSLIALLTEQPIHAISIARIKTHTTVSLYRLLGVCGLRLDSHAIARNDERVGHPHPERNIPQLARSANITCR